MNETAAEPCCPDPRSREEILEELRREIEKQAAKPSLAELVGENYERLQTLRHEDGL